MCFAIFYIDYRSLNLVVWIIQLETFIVWIYKADFILAPSKWEVLLQSKAISHELGTNLESALIQTNKIQLIKATHHWCIEFSHACHEMYHAVTDGFPSQRASNGESIPCSRLHHHPDSKVHGANMGSTWGRQDPGRPHVGPMNLAICASIMFVIGMIAIMQYYGNTLCHICTLMAAYNHVPQCMLLMLKLVTLKHCQTSLFLCKYWIIHSNDVCRARGGMGFMAFYMMTSSNGNIFRITGPLWGEFTDDWWIPHTKASDTESWCFLWSASE